MNLSGVFRQLAMSSGVIGVLALACSYYAHMTLESEAARKPVVVDRVAFKLHVDELDSCRS